MYKIMIVEDDMKITQMISDYLQKWDYEVILVRDFKKVLTLLIEEKPQLILLDINLPYYDGFYWCKEIRALSNVPIIFISSRDTEMDQIMGIHSGADDYIEKPFSLELLLTKIEAMLRRTYAYQDQSLDVIEYGPLLLDLAKTTLSTKEVTILLTPNEYKIMAILMKHGGKVVKRETLIENLWDDEKFVDDNTLTVNVNRLRRKLEEIPDIQIETLKSEGYLLK